MAVVQGSYNQAVDVAIRHLVAGYFQGLSGSFRVDIRQSQG